MLLVVANEPWQKEGLRPVTPAEDRFAMVTAACAGHVGLEPSRLELDRGGPSYTADTVDELLTSDPAAQLFLVVGADVVADLPTWKRVEHLRRRVTLAVVDRPGASLPPLPLGWSTVLVPSEPLNVSSTDLRDRLEAQLPVDDLLSGPVMRCIEQRGLYAAGR